MVAKARPRSESDFFLKVWERERLTVPLAKRILKLGFSPEDLEQVSAWRAKNSAGKITAEELAEFDAFLRASFTLSIMQSKARQFLKAATEAKVSHA